MFKKLSRTEEILKSLPDSKKITIEQISEMNRYMEEVRIDFRRKMALSEISASKVILNA